MFSFDLVEQPLARFACAPSGVRRDDQIVQLFGRLNNWMIGRRRLFANDIEGRGGDPFLPQRFDQRRFIDQRAARGVDQERRRFHQREALLVDQVARFAA